MLTDSDIAAKYVRNPWAGGAPAGGDANAPGSPEAFICHGPVPAEREQAEMLRSFLEHEGVRCVMAPCDSPAALEAIRLLVLVFSNHAHASASMQEEVALAAAAHIPIILFSTEDALPGECLEGFLRDARRIRADRDHPVFSAFDVVRQAAKVLGRDLPGVKARYWAKGAPETYAYLRITTNPPGGYIRVTWPPPAVEGPSPLYVTTTSSRVEIEAAMEGYAPRKFRRDIDADCSAMEWRVGLRPLSIGSAFGGNEDAAKANDGVNCAEIVPDDLAARRRQWDLLDVDWRTALEDASHGCDTGGGARAGQPCAVGNITVVTRSDGYWVMNAERYERLMRLYETRVLSGRAAGMFEGIVAVLRNRRACDPHFLPGFLAEAVERLRAGLLGEGSGPVAPCFDEFDEAAEARRGKWYVFDGDAYLAFGEVVRPLLPASRESGRG